MFQVSWTHYFVLCQIFFILSTDCTVWKCLCIEDTMQDNLVKCFNIPFLYYVNFLYFGTFVLFRNLSHEVNVYYA